MMQQADSAAVALIMDNLLGVDLIKVWKIMSGLCSCLSHMYERMTHGQRRGHDRKIFMPSHSIDVRSWFFSLRVIDM